MKLLWILVLASIAWRMGLGRWPWQSLGISNWPDKPAPRKTSFAEAQARALLGVEAGVGRRAIMDAHRRKVAEVHPDRGGTSEQVHAANAARDTLLAALDEASD